MNKLRNQVYYYYLRINKLLIFSGAIEIKNIKNY